MEWVYTFFMLGFILTSLSLIMSRYNIILKNSERFEGTVTKLRKLDKLSIQVCPEIEYILDGKLKKAHHCTGVPESNIDFVVGDTITVLINPKHPTVFRLNNDAPTPKKNIYFFAAMGISAIIAGLITWIFFI